MSQTPTKKPPPQSNVYSKSISDYDSTFDDLIATPFAQRLNVQQPSHKPNVQRIPVHTIQKQITSQQHNRATAQTSQSRPLLPVQYKSTSNKMTQQSKTSINTTSDIAIRSKRSKNNTATTSATVSTNHLNKTRTTAVQSKSTNIYDDDVVVDDYAAGMRALNITDDTMLQTSNIAPTVPKPASTTPLKVVPPEIRTKRRKATEK